MMCAQSVVSDVINEKSFVQQIIQNRQAVGEWAENQVFIRSSSDSGIESDLPDSIYTYVGEERTLERTAALTYGDDGRILLETGLTDRNEDGKLMKHEAYKNEYIYMQQGDTLVQEVVYSYIVNNEWVYGTKTLNFFNSDQVQIGMVNYEYDTESQEWLLDFITVTTEYDESGNPVILFDSMARSQGMEVETKYKLSYNEQNQLIEIVVYGLPRDWSIFTAVSTNKGMAGIKPHVSVMATPCNTVYTEPSTLADAIQEEWIQDVKFEIFYDDNGRRVKDLYYAYDKEWDQWNFYFTTIYTYDEKGNLKMKNTFEDDETVLWDAYYYVYVYGVKDANEVIVSVRSSVYPNPVSDILSVAIENADQATITLVDAAGAVVFQQPATGMLTSVPVRSFVKGYYFLIVQTTKGSQTHKVIIR